MKVDSTDLLEYGENKIFNNPVVKFHAFFNWLYDTFPIHTLNEDEMDECQILEYVLWNAFATYTAYTIKVSKSAHTAAYDDPHDSTASV